MIDRGSLREPAQGSVTIETKPAFKMSTRRINALTQQLAGAQLAPAPAAAEGKIPTVHCAPPWADPPMMD